MIVIVIMIMIIIVVVVVIVIVIINYMLFILDLHNPKRDGWKVKIFFK